MAQVEAMMNFLRLNEINNIVTILTYTKLYQCCETKIYVLKLKISIC